MQPTTGLNPRKRPIESETHEISSRMRGNHNVVWIEVVGRMGVVCMWWLGRRARRTWDVLNDLPQVGALGRTHCRRRPRDCSSGYGIIATAIPIEIEIAVVVNVESSRVEERADSKKGSAVEKRWRVPRIDTLPCLYVRRLVSNSTQIAKVRIQHDCKIERDGEEMAQAVGEEVLPYYIRCTVVSTSPTCAVGKQRRGEDGWMQSWLSGATAQQSRAR